MKLILDLDTGIDDAMAIAYACGHPDAELIGITTTFGNVKVEEATRNSLTILDLLGYSKIPVCEGAVAPLGSDDYAPQDGSVLFHGVNGLGEVDFNFSKRLKDSRSAVDFISEAIEKYGHDLTLVLTGPLTNLAQLLRTRKDLAGKFNVVLMGGALTVMGNMNPFAEANIYVDPLAAKEVFESAQPMTMVGLDVTMKTLLTKTETAQFRSLNKRGELFADMIDYYIDAYMTYDQIAGCALHDPLAVGIALEPTLAKVHAMHLTVETEGVSAGRTIGLHDKVNALNPNVKVCLDVNVDVYMKQFMEILSKVLTKGEDSWNTI